MSRIILASASPRRRELMELAGYDFEVICADIVEAVPENVQPQEVVMSLALQKAQAVAAENEDAVVVGSDTVVALDGKILGKPHSESEACEMLRLLSGRTHKVFTGVAVVGDGKEKSFFDETDVEFYPLGEDEIKKYVATGEPMDKAGAYAVQGFFARYIRGLRGSYANVMGLPVSRLYQEMKEL